MSIDYARAQRENPNLKAALTRAQKVSDPIKRRDAVVAACKKAVEAWEAWGAWPDGWALWQRALSDAILAAERAGNGGRILFKPVRLEEL